MILLVQDVHAEADTPGLLALPLPQSHLQGFVGSRHVELEANRREKEKHYENVHARIHSTVQKTTIRLSVVKPTINSRLLLCCSYSIKKLQQSFTTLHLHLFSFKSRTFLSDLKPFNDGVFEPIIIFDCADLPLCWQKHTSNHVDTQTSVHANHPLLRHLHFISPRCPVFTSPALTDPCHRDADETLHYILATIAATFSEVFGMGAIHGHWFCAQSIDL